MERLMDELIARFSQNRILTKIDLKTASSQEKYEKMVKSLGLKHVKNKKYVEIWVPFTVPPLPKRGSFDVQNVLHSQYFFH